MSENKKKEVVEVPEVVQGLDTTSTENSQDPDLELKVADGNIRTVRALLNLQGHFLLPYDAGQEFEINVNQAQEMVEAKYAEYVN